MTYTDSAYASPSPTKRSHTPMFLTGGLAALLTAGALAFGLNSHCEVFRHPPITEQGLSSACDHLNNADSREKCRDRMRKSDAQYNEDTARLNCTTSPMVPAFGVGAGVAGLSFLGLIGSAVIRRRGGIASIANSTLNRAQRDVTPPVGNSAAIQDYPENVSSANPQPIAHTPSTSTSEFAGGSSEDTSLDLNDGASNGNDGWDF